MVKKKSKSFLLILCLVFILLFSACDHDIAIVGYEMVQPPYRIIYIASVDTRLDFEGATIRAVARNGMRYEEFSISSGIGNYINVNHSVDFTTPGIYKVELIVLHTHESFNVHFFIQVIDEETFNQMNAGEWQPPVTETYD